MMVIMVILAFAAGVLMKVYTATGEIEYLALAVLISIVCLAAAVGFVIRDRGLL